MNDSVVDELHLRHHRFIVI